MRAATASLSPARALGATRAEQGLQRTTGRLWVSPTTVPKVVAAFDGCPGSIVALIKADFGPVWQWAVGIAMRESHCEPWVRNPSSASGLFEIKVPLHAREFAAVGCNWTQWADPACNVGAAAVLYQEVGPSPWRL